MVTARNELVTKGVEAVYHCISLSVHRAFLCDTDIYSGKSYGQRKEWTRLRIKELAAGYGMRYRRTRLFPKTTPWYDFKDEPPAA